MTAATSQVSELRNCGQTCISAGIRNEPVEKPRSAHVEQREEPRLDDGEERHRLGEAVDRRAPLLLEEEQKRAR